MARVKHTLQNGVVHLRQQNSGKLAAIDVSLYEYINEGDKPADEYEFRNGGQSSFSFTAKGGTETSSIISRYGHEGSWEDVNFSCTNHPEWATVTTTANSVSIKASANEETSLKSGSVELTQDTSNKKITIAVTLAGVEGSGQDPEPEDPYVFTIENDSISIAAETGVDSIVGSVNSAGTTVTSTKNGDWVDFTIDGGTTLGGGKLFDDWLIVTYTHTEGGTATLAVGATKNTSEDSRTQTFTLSQGGGSSKTLSVTVAQAGRDTSGDIYNFDVDPHSVHLNWSAGGNKDVVIKSSKTIAGKETEVPIEWEFFQNLDDWCHPNLTSKPGTYVFNCDNNETGSQRTGAVVIRQTEGPEPRKSQTVGVTQDAKADEEPETTTYYLNITPSSHTFDYNGGDLNLQIESYSEKGGVQTPERWKLKSDESTNWITGQDTACDGNKTQEITLHCASYDDTTQRRSCNITFEQETIQPDEKTAMVTLTQTAKPEEITYTLTISPDTVSFSPGGGKSSNITITSKKHTGSSDENFPWKYVSGAATWISGYPASGTNPQTFQIDCQNNNDVQERECTLQYKQEDPGTATATLRVQQGGTSASVEHVYLFQAIPNSVDFTYAADDKSVAVRSTRDGQPQAWNITAGGDSGWCHVTKSDHDTVEIHADENKSGEEKTNERSVQITLTQEESGEHQNITVVQGGYTPPLDEEYTYYFDVSPNSNIEFQVDNAPSAKVTVNSYKKSASSENVDVDFDYTVDDSYNGFIIVEQDPEFQSDKHHLLVKPKENNTTGEDRTGTITFKQKEPSESGQQKSVTINVTQKAPKGSV